MCLLDDSRGVRAPCQVVVEVDAQEAEVGGYFHLISVDDQGRALDCDLIGRICDLILKCAS